jgi:hypothetical protein
MDVDPALSLAMAMHSKPGGYACLLGSGVSQGVPDGWTVLLDLVGKVATHHGYQGDDPLTWYREHSDGPVGYSSVLEDLTDTPEERVALLRPYFEPVNEEGAVEAIEPSAAHRAIARLIAAGYIRVIITTNFDRLLERALVEVGVAPTVLSTPSAMAGARPLHLQRACIIKVNGDYLDPTFLNTGAELDRYEAAVDVLLDRVIDEYGLVSPGGPEPGTRRYAT